jgi:ATP-dependent RNA helicase SUPV3L1/SUV3
LEPLFRLAAADDVTGMGRGIAYQLIEALGVIDRQRIAEEVKGLEQPARATLRKYGVRFGAYHVYVPALLKPAPRALSTQLWALKHGSSKTGGLEAVERLAASGRTSIASDKDIDKVLYRTAGYRICGERAVRVDILERLADLIRAALAWRAGATSTKPPGAIDGFGFTVTVGMTSLAGCSGEDFASVLRSLGYRAEKRSEPVPPAQFASGAAHAEAGEAARSEVAGSEEALLPAITSEVIASEVIAGEQLGSEPEIAIETLGAAIVDQTSPGASPVDMEPAAPADRSLHALAAQEVIDVPQAPTLAAPEHAEAVESANASTVTAKTDEMVTTQFIEVWRPIRRDEHARGGRREQAPRRRRTRRSALPGAAGSEAATSEAATSAEGKAAPAGASEASSVSQPSGVPEASTLPKDGDEGTPRHGRHGRRDRKEPSDQVRSPRTGRPDGRQTDARTPRADRSGRQRSGERPDRPPRGDRPDRDPALRAKYIKGRGDSGSREQEPDPNSPFAKLAKLKEQLEASSKEPH